MGRYHRLSSAFGPLRLEPRHQLAWLVISIALLSNGIGGAYYTYLEWYWKLNPVFSLADFVFTIFYFLTFVGLLLMPTTAKFRRYSYSHWVGRHHYDALLSGNQLVFCDWPYIQ